MDQAPAVAAARVGRKAWGILLGALLVGLIPAPSATGGRIPSAPKCSVFPEDNHWNLKVTGLPVLGNSRKIVRSAGLGSGLHPDFGSGKYDGGPIGIPFVTVPGSQPKVSVAFTYKSESDKGPYPIPKDAPIEGGKKSGGDRHVIVVDRQRCKLYELFAARPRNGGKRWRAGSGAIWDLDSNALRPKAWTSADAAGLPILPGLVRYADVKRGRIDHALRFTVEDTRRAFIYPARHFASDKRNPNLPAMGQRFRLKKSFDISGFPRQARIVLKALKQYGMILADNGSDWFISGEPNKTWDNDALHSLSQVEGCNFEVVDTLKLPRP